MTQRSRFAGIAAGHYHRTVARWPAQISGGVWTLASSAQGGKGQIFDLYESPDEYLMPMTIFLVGQLTAEWQERFTVYCKHDDVYSKMPRFHRDATSQILAFEGAWGYCKEYLYWDNSGNYCSGIDNVLPQQQAHAGMCEIVLGLSGGRNCKKAALNTS